MEKKNTIYNAYTALAALLMLPSCVQENPGVATEVGNRIYFRSSLPTITESRAGVTTKENLPECQVTSLNPDDSELIDSDTGKMKPYFSDIRFIKDADGRYLAEDADICMWPDSKSTLHFFAYYPSVEYMQDAIDKEILDEETADEEYFNLVNNSVKEGDTPVIDYRLENFRVAADIANQVDFITAYSTGTLEENGTTGIELNFSHQLARVEISAWGASEKYDFEIAGVRVGNPIIQGDFNFSTLMPESGETAAWLTTEGKQRPVEHIFSRGEAIVLLSKKAASHADKDNAASIMGNAGPAMVIPMAEKIEKWEGKEDPAINAVPYSTNKLYFSVLLRVKDQTEGIIYPYPNDRDNIPVVYLAVSNEGIITGRVYQIDGEYYTANEKKEELRYAPNETEDIRGFCWAALPVEAKWEAGKIYTYKLNYTNGIGWQDPSDPNPGEPIIGRGMVPFEVDVDEWVAAEGHDPNLDVPKR